MKSSGFAHILLIPVVALLLVFVFFGSQHFNYSFKIFKNDIELQQNEEAVYYTNDTSDNTEETFQTAEEKVIEPIFCKSYGTFEIKKTDLFEEYMVGPGETLRDIAMSKLNDESKAVDFVIINPQLKNYEVDDELPMRIKLYIPNEKYNEEGVTAYIKSRGNIVYNKEKPMFGINAPNSGTGPFIISDTLKGELKNIKEGDCVEAIYGSRVFDPQKVVFEIHKQ